MKAQLSQSEEDLRNATIASPIDGVVLSRDREVGDAVSSILTMGSGATLIMTVGDLREVYVKGKVDESDIGKVYLGQPARITVESYKDQNFSGKVTKISPMGVEKDNVTTFEVRVSISNESRKLMATMTANAEILLEERKGVLAVPEGAILYKKDRSTEVEMADAASETGRRRVPVTTGISNGSKTQIVKGLSRGPAGDSAVAGRRHVIPARAFRGRCLQPAAQQAAQLPHHGRNRLGRGLDGADRGHGRRLQARPARPLPPARREHRDRLQRPHRDAGRRAARGPAHPARL